MKVTDDNNLDIKGCPRCGRDGMEVAKCADRLCPYRCDPVTSDTTRETSPP